MSNQKNAITLSEYMRQPNQLARFSELLGESNAKAYIQSVLIEVTSDEKLRECTVESIYKSALRAASLGLSCDKALKQAWLVPYNRKIKSKNGQADTWVKEAQFQPHYKGLYTLAMRTGKYWTINVAPVYEGQRVLENPLTGLHVVQEGSFIGQPQSYNSAYVDVTVRRKKEMKIIGWIGYFKTKRGAEKSVWMSTQDIEDHAAKFVRDYDKNPNWNDADKRPTMEMKTVLRQLLSWADMSGTENSQLVAALQAEEEPEAIEGHAEEVENDLHPITIEEARSTIITTNNGKEKFMSELSVEQLNKIYLSDKSSEAQKNAAKLILKVDNSMEPPEQPKRTAEQSIKELGF
jgi:recombination protein RecT